MNSLGTEVDYSKDISIDSAKSAFRRLVMLLKYAGDVWSLAVFDQHTPKDFLAQELNSELSSTDIVEIQINRLNTDPLELIMEKVEFLNEREILVSFSSISKGFPDLFGYLDIQRETLAELPVKILIWATEFDRILLAKYAPNFYSRLSGVFRLGTYSYERSQKEGTSTELEEVHDDVLLHLALNGDAIAFNTIYLTYSPMVSDYISARHGHNIEAEDVTAQVFAQLFEHLRKKNFLPSDLKSWLFATTDQLIINILLEERNLSFAYGLSLPEAALVHHDEYSEIFGGRDSNFLNALVERENLLSAFQHLTDVERDVIVLRYLENRSVAEVANLLELSPSSIASLQFRAIRKLRTILVKL